MERIGNYIQTHTGIRFYPFDPREYEIDIVDIASALSNICRFTGHTNTFYSVAQHSVLCSFKAKPENALYALLHDASEAYLGDIARPIKIMPEMLFYRNAEKRIQGLIHTQFGLNRFMTDETKSEIKRIDDRMLFTEKRDLLDVRLDWGYEIKPYKEAIVPVSSDEAFIMFMNRFTEITRIAA